jgi:hypothetical protein
MISARRFGERQQPSGCWRGYARNLSGWISAYPRAVPKGLPMLFWLEIVRFGRLKLLREKSEQRLRIMAWDDVVRAFASTPEPSLQKKNHPARCERRLHRCLESDAKVLYLHPSCMRSGRCDGTFLTPAFWLRYLRSVRPQSSTQQVSSDLLLAVAQSRVELRT